MTRIDVEVQLVCCEKDYFAGMKAKVKVWCMRGSSAMKGVIM